MYPVCDQADLFPTSLGLQLCEMLDPLVVCSQLSTRPEEMAEINAMVPHTKLLYSLSFLGVTWKSMFSLAASQYILSHAIRKMVNFNTYNPLCKYDNLSNIHMLVGSCSITMP